MKYVLLAAACCLLGCHQTPGMFSNNLADTGSSPNADVAETSPDQADMDNDVGPVASALFRTTDGLVAQFSMRGDTNMNRKIVDDLDENQELSTEGGEDLDRRLVLEEGEIARGAIPSATQRITESGAWTFEVWLDAQSASGTIFMAGDVELRGSPSGSDTTIRLYVNRNAFLNVSKAWVSGLQQFVVSYDGVTTRIYLNGFVIGATNNAFEGVFDNTLQLGGEALRGTYEYVAIYDRALSPGEVAMHTAMGGDPLETDERSDDSSTIFAHPYCRGCGRVVDAVERSMSTDFTASGLRFDGFSALQRFAFDEPPPYLNSSNVLFAGYRLITEFSYDTGSLDFFELTSSWSADADWYMRTSQDSWEQDGAVGASDRAAEPFASALTTDNGLSDYTFVDVTDIAQKWLDTPAENHGWLLEWDGGGGNWCPDSQDSAAPVRPALVVVGSAPVPAPPEAPSNVQQAPVDSQILLTWDGAASSPDYEIYRDGYLYGRTSQSRYTVSEGEYVHEVFAMDGFGQRSDGVLVP